MKNIGIVMIQNIKIILHNVLLLMEKAEMIDILDLTTILQKRNYMKKMVLKAIYIQLDSEKIYLYGRTN